MGTRQKKKASISVPPEVWERIETAREASRENRSDWIVRACETQLENEERMVRVLSNPQARQWFFKAFSQPEALRAMADAMGAEPDVEQLELFGEAIGQVADALDAADEAAKK